MERQRDRGQVPGKGTGYPAPSPQIGREELPHPAPTLGC